VVVVVVVAVLYFTQRKLVWGLLVYQRAKRYW